MKRAVIWFLLSCKRCLRKGIFPLLLLLMPLAAFVAGRLSDKEEGEIPVAVSVSGEENVSERSLAWRLAERLADRKDGMFDFYICSDEAQVRDEVASRRAECGYVIDSGLEEKLDQKQWKRVIRLYMAPSTVAGSISTETVFSELAALYNRNLLMDYVEEGEAFAGWGLLTAAPERKQQKKREKGMTVGIRKRACFISNIYMKRTEGEDQRTGWRHRVQNLMQQAVFFRFAVWGPSWFLFCLFTAA